MEDQIVQNFLNDKSVNVTVRRNYQSALNSGKGTASEASAAIMKRYGDKYGVPTPSAPLRSVAPQAPVNSMASPTPAATTSPLTGGNSSWIQSLLKNTNPVQALGAVAPDIGRGLAAMGQGESPAVPESQSRPVSSLVVPMPRIEPKDALQALWGNVADIGLGAADFAGGMIDSTGALGKFVTGQPISGQDMEAAALKTSQGFNRMVGGGVKTAAAPVIAGATIAPTFVEDVYGAEGVADAMRGAESAVATVGNLPNAGIGNTAKLLLSKFRPDLSPDYVEENVVKPLQTAYQVGVMARTMKKKPSTPKVKPTQTSTGTVVDALDDQTAPGQMTPTKANLLRSGISEQDANMIDKLTPEQSDYLYKSLEQGKAAIDDPIKQPNVFKWASKDLDDSLDKLDKTRTQLGKVVGEARKNFTTQQIPVLQYQTAIVKALDDADVNAVKVGKDGGLKLDFRNSDIGTDPGAVKALTAAASLLDKADDQGNLSARDVAGVIKQINTALDVYSKNGASMSSTGDFVLSKMKQVIDENLLYSQNPQYAEAAKNYAKFMDDYKAVKAPLEAIKGGDTFTKTENFLRSGINNSNQYSQTVIPAWQRLAKFGIETPQGLDWKPWILSFAQRATESAKPGSLEGMFNTLASKVGGASRVAGTIKAVKDYVQPTEQVRASLNKIENIVAATGKVDQLGNITLPSAAWGAIKSAISNIANPTVSQELKDISGQSTQKKSNNPLSGLIPVAHAADWEDGQPSITPEINPPKNPKHNDFAERFVSNLLSGADKMFGKDSITGQLVMGAADTVSNPGKNIIDAVKGGYEGTQAAGQKIAQDVMTIGESAMADVDPFTKGARIAGDIVNLGSDVVTLPAYPVGGAMQKVSVAKPVVNLIGHAYEFFDKQLNDLYGNKDKKGAWQEAVDQIPNDFLKMVHQPLVGFMRETGRPIASATLKAEGMLIFKDVFDQLIGKLKKAVSSPSPANSGLGAKADQLINKYTHDANTPDLMANIKTVQDARDFLNARFKDEGFLVKNSKGKFDVSDADVMKTMGQYKDFIDVVSSKNSPKKTAFFDDENKTANQSSAQSGIDQAVSNKLKTDAVKAEEVAAKSLKTVKNPTALTQNNVPKALVPFADVLREYHSMHEFVSALKNNEISKLPYFKSDTPGAQMMLFEDLNDLGGTKYLSPQKFYDSTKLKSYRTDVEQFPAAAPDTYNLNNKAAVKDSLNATKGAKNYNPNTSARYDMPTPGNRDLIKPHDIGGKNPGLNKVNQTASAISQADDFPATEFKKLYPTEKDFIKGEVPVEKLSQSLYLDRKINPPGQDVKYYFHGTKDSSWLGKNDFKPGGGENGTGMYITESPGYAQMRTRGGGDVVVVPAKKLNLFKAPADISGESGSKMWAAKQVGINPNQLLSNDMIDVFNNKIKAQGYDGVYYPGRGMGIIFDPKPAIKSMFSLKDFLYKSKS
jgi:hypothetical protein